MILPRRLLSFFFFSLLWVNKTFKLQAKDMARIDRAAAPPTGKARWLFKGPVCKNYYEFYLAKNLILPVNTLIKVQTRSTLIFFWFPYPQKDSHSYKNILYIEKGSCY